MLPPPLLNRLHRYWPWLVLVGCLLMAGIVRWRLAEMPLERDEGEYAYAGQLIRQGIPPYQLAYNMKFPGTYLAYAGLMTLFGESTAGIHAGLMLVTSISTFLVFLLGRKLMGDIGGATAALSFAAVSASPRPLGMAAHATHFVVLFSLAGFLLLPGIRRTTNTWWTFVAGVCFALAVLMKQHAAFLAVFALGLIIWHSRSERRLPWANCLPACACYSLGCALPFLIVFFWLWRAGVWDNFTFWTLTYAREYVGQVPLLAAPGYFWDGLSNVAGPTWGLFVAALAGLPFLFVTGTPIKVRVFLLGLLGSSLLAICPGFYFREHYFLLLAPVIALLTGIALQRAIDVLKPELRSTFGPLGTATGLFVLAWSTSGSWPIWFEMSPSQATRTIYYCDVFNEVVPVADYIRQNSKPDSRIAVLGSEPELYFLARRHSASGYIYAYPLTEAQPFALKMQREMIKEIEASRPQYVVFVDVYKSWLPRNGSSPLLAEWWQGYSSNYYEPVGVIDMPLGSEPIVVWGKEAQGYARVYPMGVVTYRKKQSAL